MEIKILGICGSPIKNGNTEAFLLESLRSADQLQGVTTELVSLAGKNINDCSHCNWCLTMQENGRPCAQNDDLA